ncbi:MAG TPA: metallophosphoesterase [Candidatus Rifleibacterium sp.]|nr:metallophosphoesterase [Candidatus Rifleibacterium sp.]
MNRYSNLLFILALLVLTALIADPASAANPFTTKDSLNITDSGATDAAGSAVKEVTNTSGVKDANAVTLAVMADLHARPESLPLLQKAVSRVNSLKDIYALAITGDLCSRLGTREEYEVLAQGLKGLKVPSYAVPGNHDILYQDNLINGEKKRAAPAIKKAKQELFKKTLNLKSLYYSRKVGGHLLIFLPNDTLSGIPCVLPSDDAFEFLLKTLRENRNLPTIIFCHAPLTGSYGDKRTMPPIQANAQPARKLANILKNNPQIYLWFAGHLHITPSQKYYNAPFNKVGGVTVIHVPPSQIHSSWLQTVRLSSKGAVVRTMDVKTGRYLKKHTRVFRPSIAAKGQNKEDSSNQNDNKNDKVAKKARIVITNAHSGGNRDRNGFGNWLADQNPDVALISEAVGMPQHLRPAGRVFNAGSETRGRQEVAVVIRDGLKVLDHDSGKISPDLNVGIAHDRWWSRVSTRVAGIRTRVYSIHLNAVIQERDGNPMPSKRWDVTREGLVGLEKRLRDDLKDGWAVIIGGDFNWNDSRTHAQSHKMAPGRILKRLGLTYVNNELMWLAWSPKYHRSVKRLSMPPTSIPGLYAGEHPALRIDLQAMKQADGKDDGKKDDKDDDKDGLENNEEDKEEQAIIDEEEPKEEPESIVDEAELEPETAEPAELDDDLINDAEEPTIIENTSETGISEISEDPADEGEELPETAVSDTTSISEEEDSEDAAPATDNTTPQPANPSDSETSEQSDNDQNQAAIERIRELITSLYEHLLEMLSAFSSLLRS